MGSLFLRRPLAYSLFVVFLKERTGVDVSTATLCIASISSEEHSSDNFSFVLDKRQHKKRSSLNRMSYKPRRDVSESYR